VFTIRAGVHRLQSITPKSGQSFQGEPGAIVSGAKVLTGWVQDGSRWYVTGQTQQGPVSGVCFLENPGCNKAEDLWIDGVLKWHATSLSGVVPGKWFFDYAADRIYVGDDPGGRSVETSVTTYAFAGGAANVTVKGLVIEKYAGLSSVSMSQP
jgi:hypothetical protein